MATLTTDDGIELYYEDTGSGTPIVFVHEFAGDHRSWAPQVRYFARRYRCIAYAARGYPPSAVPEDVRHYSQQRARDDIRCVLDALNLERAHIVGLSMGAFATLHFGMTYGERALSLVAAGIGYGAEPAVRAQFQADSLALAQSMLDHGMQHTADTYGHGPTRVQLRDKDPQGFAEFVHQFAEHSALGSANTQRGVQAQRPSLYDLADEMAAVSVPLLVVAGDEDEPSLDASLMIKRTVASAALAMLPKSGHALNLEEPALFNRLLDEFFHTVENGRWVARRSE